MGRHVFGRSENFSYWRFIASRFKRIYPAFLVSYIAAVSLAFYFGMSWRPYDALTGLVFLNAIPALGVIPYHYVSWSIGFEFFFYFVFPALLLGNNLIPAHVRVGAAFVACLLLTTTVPDFEWALRLTGLFAGLWLSFVPDTLFKSMNKSIPWYLWISPYVFYLLTRDTPPQLWSFLLSLVSGACLLSVIVFGRNPLSRAAETKIARFLGTISYSFYLWHTLCLSVAFHIIMPRLGLNGGNHLSEALMLAAIAMSLSVFVSYASYIATERFYFSKKHRVAGASTIIQSS